MKKKLLVLALLIVIGRSEMVFAQQPKPLINSGELLEEGKKLHEEGKYKDAISRFSMISRSDTNYSYALHELTLSTYSDSNFIASRRYAELGLQLFPNRASDWYNLTGNALDALGKSEEALAMYDSSLLKDPNKYLAWYNKGMAYYHLKNLPKSKAAFETAVLINPYYSFGHYFLGRVALEQGELVRAILCLTTNLLVNPENKYNRNSINLLTAIASVSDDVAKYINARKIQGEDLFELQQEILLSKIALDQKYKLTASIEDPITRQLQVVLEKLEFAEDKNDFYMQYYVPFYQQLYAEKKYDLLLNHMFRDLPIKSVTQFKKTHVKELDAFIDFTGEYFNLIQQTRTLVLAQRKNVKTFYMFGNGICTGKGSWTRNGTTVSVFGNWEFYFDNGALKSKGALTTGEKKSGEWTFYYYNGVMKERSFFVNDTASGKSILWFDNGNINEEKSFVNGELEGEVKSYYYNGQLKTSGTYHNGLMNGLLTGYRSNGKKEYEAGEKNGKRNGMIIYFHPNGKQESAVNFVDDLAQGKVQRFYENGVLELEGQKVNDKSTGQWKGYYPSAKLKETYAYADDKLEGEYLVYHENGKIKERSFYSKGVLDRKDSEYDEDGKLFGEVVFSKGKTEQIHFFDKNGVELSNGNVHGGKVAFYNANRNKISEGYFNKDGIREGKTTIFYPGGKISVESEYKNGALAGEYVSYDKKHEVTEKSFFTDDKRDGYNKTFHENGQLKTEGWFVEGEKQGPHFEYNCKGDLVSETYYRNDVQDGYTVYYSPNGKKDYEHLFDEGWLTRVTQFDSTGKIAWTGKLEKGNCDAVFYHNNGHKMASEKYEHYFKNGRSELFFFDGTIWLTSFYDHGVKDSTYREYYYGGKTKTEGAYKYGNRTGTWKHYYENGVLNYEEVYVDGNNEGKIIFHDEAGVIDKESYYKNGLVDGPTTYFSENGSVAVVFNYVKDALLSYTYEGPDGKLVAPVALPGGTGQATAYFRNGKKSAEISFEDNMVNGARKLYFPNGNIYVDGVRIMNSDNGVKKVYYPGGQLAKEENYYYDNHHGSVKTFYPDGKLKKEENWYCNELAGPSVLYDKDNRIIERRNYYYNILQSVK